MTSPLERAPSPDEQAVPPCPHFGPCGGCQLQHLTYAAQLARKSEHLHALIAAAIPNTPEIELHASPPFAYRNRIRLTLSRTEGQLRAGYLRAISPESRWKTEADPPDDLGPDEPFAALPVAGKTAFLPITECPIAAPILWQTAEALLAHAAEADGFWLNDPRHLPDQLELFTNADQSRLNLTLSLRTNSRTLPDRIVQAFQVSCEHLRQQIPALSGAGLALLPPASRARSRRGEAPRPGATWGQPGLNYSVETESGAFTYWVPRTAFFQVNRFLIPELLATALKAAAASSPKELAWDLYAGAGLFARPLTQHFTDVVAVEIAEAASTTLASVRIPNLRAVRSTTLDFLRNAVLQRERPDLVLLDPPRTGAGAEVCELLGRIAAPTLIYVSCSPARLAADLQVLAVAGYKLTSLHLFDLFPQTTHIETLAILTR